MKENVGELLLQIEKRVTKLLDIHGFQWGDWLYNQWGWLKIHRKDPERYLDGSTPIFYYGPAPDKEKLARNIVSKLREWENSKIELKTAQEIIAIVEEEYGI